MLVENGEAGIVRFLWIQCGSAAAAAAAGGSFFVMPKYFHVIHLPFPVEKKKTLLQISRRPSLLVVRLLTSTLQVYLYIFTLQNYIYIYKTISEMSAPTTIPALDEASKVRTILQKS